MKEFFASADFGILGLIFFLVLFCGVVIWTLRPSARQEYKEHGNIPLKGDQNNDRS